MKSLQELAFNRHVDQIYEDLDFETLDEIASMYGVSHPAVLIGLEKTIIDQDTKRHVCYIWS